jgi:hypothetical protein
LQGTVLTAQDVRDLVERMLKISGRRVDLSSPLRRCNRATTGTDRANDQHVRLVDDAMTSPQDGR